MRIRMTFGFFLLFFIGLCTSAAAPSPLYRDAALPVSVRVEDLLRRMTHEEKIAQMCQYVGLEHMRNAERDLTPEQIRSSDALGFYKGLPSDDVAAMAGRGEIGSFLHVLTAQEANLLQSLALKSRLGIPLIIGIDAIHGNALVKGATVYPTPIGLASTWEPELVRRIGRQTALEMRATGSHWAFTPNVDVARDARWGRVGETFGEDPHLVSVMGAAMVRGMQGEDFSGPEYVIACAKHMIAGSEPVNGLNIAPMDVSERTLREIFLPPYEAALKAGAFTVMAAHNELNGVPCHANSWLFNDILRVELGFSGFVVSDWMDIERLESLHAVAGSPAEASSLSVLSGIDMHMHGPHFFDHILESVRSGGIPESRIDRGVGAILRAKFKLGLFEKSLVDLEAVPKFLFNAQHRATALEAARKSVVLLKNDSILPLDAGRFKNIFVTGPNADNQTLLGDWASEQPGDNVITIAEGLKRIAPPGCEVTFFNCGENARLLEDEAIRRAGRLAAGADIVVAVLGENSMRYRWNERTCGENMARARIDLSGNQMDLFESLNRTGKPVVVVLVNGRPLGIPRVVERAAAVLEAWEPGAYGGRAVAEILFGEVNPSGRLPISVPYSAGQIQTVYNHKPSHYYRHYVFEKTGPLFPFGYGLSYTSFEYDTVRLAPAEIDRSGSVRVEVDLRNSGERAGEEIVQLYLGGRISRVTRPVLELKAFRRVPLKPGQSRTVVFELEAEQLASYDIDMVKAVETGRYRVYAGPSSRTEDLLHADFEVK